jgi:polyhydroxybutyrate depolymerase
MVAFARGGFRPRGVSPRAAALSALLALEAAIGPATAARAGVPPDGAGCGDTAPGCRVELGSYHVEAPPWREGDPARPVLVHLHGSSGSGTGVLEQRSLVAPALARGYAVVAPEGMPRPGRVGGHWAYGGRRSPARDELAFLREVLDDAAPRFHLDRGRVLLSGFSAGAALVWKVACEAPGEFAAFAPVAGGFGRTVPATCKGPVRLLDTHGWRDDAVPVEGWPGRTGLEPGDVFVGMDFWRRVNRCVDEHADRFATDERFWMRAWRVGCAPETALELVLHPGGHEVPEGWTTLALDWFESVVLTGRHRLGSGAVGPG